MSNIVIISGYFNPLHIGHLDYIEAAKELGEELWVIVNSDEQVEIKGSVPFQKETERHRIVSAISGVDVVLLASDRDHSVTETLRNIIYILPDDCTITFANGGDRKSGNTPEEDFCCENGIKTVYNVGGGKIQSSRNLLKEAIK